MLKRLLLIASILIGALSSLAQPAANYYTSGTLDGKSGRELELALAAIVYPHTRISYDDLWEKFEITDPGPLDSIPAGHNRSDLVYDMYAWMQLRPHFYSENDHTQTSGINREHALPNSWWGGKDGNTEAYSDLHHLVPSDGAANNKKSNYPLGEGNAVAGATGSNTACSGAKLWNISQANAADYGGSQYLWEPTDEYKGDFARMYLYVVCAYENRITWNTEYMFTSDNQLTTIRPWAKDLLLKWHRQDPISAKERARNNAVEGIQGNRNPFIDYPELVEYIWGDKTSQVFTLNTALSSYSDEYINEGNTPSTPGATETATGVYFPFIAYLGRPFEAPRLTTLSDGALTYTSSNTDVAEVDATTGEVTVKGVGYAIITVTQAETALYKSATASYMIEVRNR